MIKMREKEYLLFLFIIFGSFYREFQYVKFELILIREIKFELKQDLIDVLNKICIFKIYLITVDDKIYSFINNKENNIEIINL